MKKTNAILANAIPTLFKLTTLAWLSAVASYADWPQFLGPNGNATSSEKGLLRTMPDGGPKVLWTAKLGKGYGGAAIRDGKVYLLDRVGQKEDVLRCHDLATGKEDWTFAYEAPGAINHDGSRSTPAVSESSVFTIGPFGQLHCLNKASHQVVWKKNLLTDYGAKKPNWAVTQSPLLYKNLLIVAPQSDSVGVVALDQATGKEQWRSKPVGPMAYCSPLLLTIDGQEQFVVVNKDGAASVSAVDGQVLWTYEHPCKIPVPNVSDLGGGKLFITGGYNAGSAILQVSREGDKWVSKQLARINGIGGHCHPGLVYKDHIYVLCNTNERQDGLVCLDFNGTVKWQTKKDPYLCKGGSILTADGMIYIVDGQSGEFFIVQPSSEGFKSQGKAKLLEGREIWGPLALSDGKLLIRDQGQIKCLDVRAN